MANIKELIHIIRTNRYGRNIRNAIADALALMTDDWTVPSYTAAQTPPHLGDMPMYERNLLILDHYNNQGITTDGTYIYSVCSDSGYVWKIDMITGDCRNELIGANILHHANSCAYSCTEKTVYICANGGNENNNNIVVIDAESLSIRRTIHLIDSDGNPVYPHGIAVDDASNHFYVALSFAKKGNINVIEYTSTGEYVRTIEFDDYYSTLASSVQQGLEYDGTYFYVPLYQVNGIAGYNIIAIYDRNGKHVRTQPAMEDAEIEDLCYDCTSGRMFVNYNFGGRQLITEFTTDSGWLKLKDYIKSGASNITANTVQIRIKDGILYIKGNLKVTNSGDLFKLSARVSPQTQKPRIMCYAATNGVLAEAGITYLQLSSYTNPLQSSYYVYCPDSGSIWLDGICIPMN